MTHIYLVTVNLEIFSEKGTSIVLYKHKHVFLSSQFAKDKARHYQTIYKSTPNNVYSIEVRCLEVEK